MSGYYEDFGPLPLLAKALRQAWVYDGIYSPHRQRVHGRRRPGWRGSQFVVFAQNHDQVGNRAAGERSSALMSDGRLRVAAALLLTSPFVPMLFQGEEWGASTPFQYFTSHTDPGLGQEVSEGRRQEFADFGWDPADVPDPQDPATFERSRLDWAELVKEPHAGLLAWHRELIALRRRLAEFTDPRLDRVADRIRSGCRLAGRPPRDRWRWPPTSAPAPGPSRPARRQRCWPRPIHGSGAREQGVVLPPDTVAIVAGARAS